MPKLQHSKSPLNNNVKTLQRNHSAQKLINDKILSLEVSIELIL